LERSFGADSFQAFLSSFILPPVFSITDVSTRFKYEYNESRKSRFYPRKIEAWTEFSVSIVEKHIQNTFGRKPGAVLSVISIRRMGEMPFMLGTTAIAGSCLS
jgi:hypothetical protein